MQYSSLDYLNSKHTHNNIDINNMNLVYFNINVFS